MSTIGELERRAGIGSSPEERMAFWIRFRHLDGSECLKAGVAELNRLVAEREAMPVTASNGSRPKPAKLRPLDPEEQQALQAHAAKHGRRWKSILNRVWMGEAPHDDAGTLRRLCNSHGPSWLQSYRLPKTRLPDGDAVARTDRGSEIGDGEI
ncbi:hypothetical protein OE766_26700 [Pararhizobium sp. YC-54]|uniref:hypothetical protein n=1 Tax=Pararhizobium sp. YC-54 TaxID=2986920 RepID=UPI0021F788D8|nr:hypothetical protein [Pararhizobium sp. YC-54]MCW0001809.1 hypothetical protein [Pararhizobium sp. YC-54]